ncbi:MAG: permease-like cell division protein FtsX [Pseudomonadota bacterium]
MTRAAAKKTKPAGSQTRSNTPSAFSTLFTQHQEIAIDSLLRLLLEPLASLLTWTVIAIALALPLTLILLLQNLQQVGNGIDQVSNISLFMVPAATTGSIDETVKDISLRADVAEVSVITPEQALAEFEQNSGFGEVLQGLETNPLPAVILVTPALTSQTEVQALQNELAENPNVEYAQLDLAWLQRLNAIVELAARMTTLLAVMLGVGVILVIGNTVRLAIENRRAEIVVTKLVGGTDAYVSRPFLYTGLWYGAGGGLLALLLINLIMFGLQGPIARLAGVYDSNFGLIGLGISNSVLVFVFAGLLGWFGAWISVLRHLRAIEPR